MINGNINSTISASIMCIYIYIYMMACESHAWKYMYWKYGSKKGGFNGVDINLMIFRYHACIQPRRLGLIWWKNVFYRFINGILIVMIMVLYRFNGICRDYSPRKTGLNGSEWPVERWYIYIYRFTMVKTKKNMSRFI